MPRGGVAARLRGELGILQVGVGRHAALPIAAGQLEHTVVQAVEAGQGHELELVAHGTDLALETGDVVLAEVGRQVERRRARSEEHTSELPSLMRSSYADFCLKKKIIIHNTPHYKAS